MKTSSCKAKGRRLSQSVKDTLLSWAPDLHPDDIVVTPSGVNGPDVMLSPAAKSTYPFAIECKNTEAINVWKAFEQAKSHVTGDLTPLLVFSRNRSDVMVCLRFEDFLKLVR